jgi:hypothetical protein
VGVIFLRGGDGAKDGQKLVAAEQRSQKKAGKQEAGVEDGRSWAEQEYSLTAGLIHAEGSVEDTRSWAGQEHPAGTAWTPLPPGGPADARGDALAALAGAGYMPGAKLVPTHRGRRQCAKRAWD